MKESVKAKTYDKFWKSFNIPAYEENSIPTGKNKPSFPYITYEASTATFNEPIALTASLWFRSPSWEPALDKADEVAERINMGGAFIEPDDCSGCIWIKRGQPFIQRLPDEAEDNMIKRILLNLDVEFISDDE